MLNLVYDRTVDDVAEALRLTQKAFAGTLTDEEKTVSQQRGGDAKIKSPAVRRPQDDDGNLGDEQRRKADLGKCKQKTVCAALKFAEKRDDNAQHSADQRRDGDDTDAVADAQKEINHHTQRRHGRKNLRDADKFADKR